MNLAIEGAKRHIHLETFIIRDDSVGRHLADLLLQKRSEGVQVRLIYDSFGCKSTPAEFFERMRAGGIQVYEFNPIGNTGLWGKRTINNRDHRKILVVSPLREESISMASMPTVHPPAAPGANGDDDIYWRDTHIQIEGPAVVEFQRLFLKTWSGDEKEPLAGPEYFAPLEKKGDALIRVISSTPDQPIPNIYAAYLSAMNSAQESIWITQAFPDRIKEWFSRLFRYWL